MFSYERILVERSRPRCSPTPRRFVRRRLNTCFNCLDRHLLAGPGGWSAMIYESPVTNPSSAITYRELLERVACFAGALDALGVQKGDRVLICMPMIPETLVAMLACSRLGRALSRIRRICGRGARCTHRQRALELADWQVQTTVVRQRAQSPAVLRAGRDHDGMDLEPTASPAACAPVAATDPATSCTRAHHGQAEGRRS